jgi:hypothetical protein
MDHFKHQRELDALIDEIRKRLNDISEGRHVALTATVLRALVYDIKRSGFPDDWQLTLHNCYWNDGRIPKFETLTELDEHLSSHDPEELWNLCLVLLGNRDLFAKGEELYELYNETVNGLLFMSMLNACQ